MLQPHILGELLGIDQGSEKILPGKNIPIESERERDGANQDGKHLQHSHKEEQGNQQKKNGAAHPSLDAEEFLDKGNGARGLHGPDEP